MYDSFRLSSFLTKLLRFSALCRNNPDVYVVGLFRLNEDKLISVERCNSYKKVLQENYPKTEEDKNLQL